MESKPTPDSFKTPAWMKRKTEMMERAGWRCESCGNKERELDVFFWRRENAEPITDSYRNAAILCVRCIGVERRLRPTAEAYIKEVFNSGNYLAIDIIEAAKFVLQNFSPSVTLAHEERLNESTLLMNEAMGHPDVAELVIKRKELQNELLARAERLGPDGEFPPGTRELLVEQAKVGRLLSAFIEKYMKERGAS